MDPKKIAQLIYLFFCFRWLRKEMEDHYNKHPQLLSPEAKKAFFDIAHLEISSFRLLTDAVDIDFILKDNGSVKIKPPDPNSRLQVKEVEKIKLKALMHLLNKCNSDIKKADPRISWLYAGRQIIRELLHKVEVEYRKHLPPKLDIKTKENHHYFDKGLNIDSVRPY